MNARILTNGKPVPEDNAHTKLRANGQQESYVVLSAEERAKGFVKPVRQSYRHDGPPPLPNNLRELTEEEHQRYDNYGYVRYESYGDEATLTIPGKYWTQAEIDR